MAAAIKALNAKIRSNKFADYFCSTRTYCPPSAVFSARSSPELRRTAQVCCCAGATMRLLDGKMQWV
jgi:hypothetical protein